MLSKTLHIIESRELEDSRLGHRLLSDDDFLLTLTVRPASAMRIRDRLEEMGVRAIVYSSRETFDVVLESYNSYSPLEVGADVAVPRYVA